MRRTSAPLVVAALLCVAAPLLPPTAAASAGSTDTTDTSATVAAAPSRGGTRDVCDRRTRIRVPGAERQRVSGCLDDLTTYGLLGGVYSQTNPRNGDLTDYNDFRGLHAAGTVNPRGVPGVQVDGHFRDTSATNPLHGWDSDSQFVIRLPERWNGRLVVTGAPGVRRQYANDFLISDQVLAQGYAYASIDKGNTGPAFFTDGRKPGDAIREWHRRVTQVARAAKTVARQAYGSRPERTYMTGISNGGYLTRWQLENRPSVFDGGVEWEGTLFERDDHLLTYLPEALRAYPAFSSTASTEAEREAARQAMHDAGFAPGSEFLWPFHHANYWDLTQRIYREELDPTYDGPTLAGTPFCRTGGPAGTPTACDAEYDASERSRQLRRALRGLTLDGDLRRPMLSLHGTLDALLPISLHGDRYRELVEQAGRADLHRYYVVEGGQHVDGLFGVAGFEPVRPILPCYRRAFDAMVAWVERGEEPPAGGPVQPETDDPVHECEL